MGPTSAVDVAMRIDTRTRTTTDVRRWLSPRFVAVSRPRERTESLRVMSTRASAATATSGTAIGKYSFCAFAMDPKRRAVSTSNSEGVRRRCMKVEMEPRPAPSMTPMRSIACIEARCEVSSHE